MTTFNQKEKIKKNSWNSKLVLLNGFQMKCKASVNY